MIRVALLCISPLQHDSRVLRHAALLAKAGFDVRIFAQGPLPTSSPAPVTTLPGPGSDTRARLGLVLRQAPASVLPVSADALYWFSQTKLAARREVLRFKPDLVIANDWRALPVAWAAKRANGARIIYDSHEFASEEFADSCKWRLLARQHVVRIEDRYIRAADAVVAVSAGIAEALASRYGIPRPTVVANTPAWHATVFRPTESRVTVLYQGVVVPRRGLETLIESVALWPERFRLVIRGPAQGGFDRHLRGLAQGLESRVVFEPAVPPDQVVPAAATADIGIFLLSDSTTHAHFAMPNKIFEYMQAGLMIMSSNLPEIRRVIETAGSGVLLADDTPRTIAAAIGGLEPTTIDSYKRASLESARTLNFETEGAKLLALAIRLAPPGPPAARQAEE